MKHSELRKYFAEILFLYILLSCLIPNVALCFTERYTAAAALANILLPAGVYTLLMASTRRIGRAGCWMFIVMFFAAFQIVLLSLFGRSVIAVDMFLNVLTTNPTEVGELLGNMLPVIILVVVLYVPPLVASVVCNVRRIRLSDRFRAGARRAGIVATSAGVACLITAYLMPGGYRVADDLYPVNVGYNIYLAASRTVKISDYHRASADFTYHARSTRPQHDREIYVAVIGETSRAPQWHLFGYARNTTAPLDSVGNLFKFPQTLSESNTTHKSVPMLMSSLDASSFEDSVYIHKGVIAAFKEAGFHTMYISNQARNHSFIDFFGEEADSTLFINEIAGTASHRYDHEMLSVMKDAISRNSACKQLYVLHCYGSHFSYPDRYPSGTGSFLPDYPVEVAGSNHQRLVNAYDNTIEYTARFLADLSQMLAAYGCRSAYVYTSDHGEDIFDDDRGMFLHASPVPSYYQIHVPMLVWFSPAYAASHPQTAGAALGNEKKAVSSSRSYFHTLLDLAGIESPFLRREASLIEPTYKPMPPLYLDDHNEGISLWECGMMEQDIEALRRAGFSGPGLTW